MSWGQLVEELREREEWEILLSLMTSLPADLASRQLKSLKESSFQPPSEVAARLLRDSDNPQDFEAWSRPPWEESASRGHLEPLLSGLHQDYLAVSEVLCRHEQLWPRLLALLETDRWPALDQWVAENEIPAQPGLAGWREASLLQNIDLSVSDLVEYLEHPRYKESARTQFASRPYREALVSLLQIGSEQFESLPKISSPLEAALSAMLQKGKVDRALLQRACQGQIDAIAHIWKTNPYPALADWYRELSGLEPGPVAAAEPDEQVWLTLHERALHDASVELRRLVANGFSPRHRPDLFDDAAKLCESGPLLPLYPTSSPLTDLAADQVWFDEDEVVGYHQSSGVFWSHRWQGEPVRVESPDFLGQVKRVWSCPLGFLVYGVGVHLVGLDGQVKWYSEDVGPPMDLNSEGCLLAVREEFGVVLFDVDTGARLRQGQFTSIEPAPPRSNVFFVDGGARGRALCWSEDESLLVTSHKQYAYVWDVDSLTLRHSLEHSSGVTRVLFWDDQLVAVGGGQLGNTSFLGSPTQFWDPRTGEKLQSLSTSGMGTDGLFIRGERLIVWSDCWPMYVEIFEREGDKVELVDQLVLEDERHRGEAGLKPVDVQGTTLLFKNRNGDHALASLGDGELQAVIEGPAEAQLIDDGKRMFLWKLGRLSLISLLEENPVGALDSEQFAPTVGAFILLMKELES
jgi:WD40 repeat protein